MQGSTQSLPLAPIHLPQEPGIWPLAWGWWALIAAVVIALVLGVYFFQKYQKKVRAKREALKQIKNITSASESMNIVRQAALSYFPREQVAPLTGEAWYEFLDAQNGQSRFAEKSEQWNNALYASGEPSQELLKEAEKWIKQALPPRSKVNLKKVKS
ncbi:DUF4381 domain-containing protein [Vibrio sp. SCSIO 43132]|uniref:DUF4381 domain-containing protein n=1 Tax=Vibrio sp. SCSIO 43132 TaxID=2779363 RepID=UPI001CA91313|nr:DUF4381 domain-containing protein [Vibrio sp. SCSIO 43132]UAB72841.1 DUF4381 domain-containing protein [Vibrio sp. SCSIO 43132]